MIRRRALDDLLAVLRANQDADLLALRAECASLRAELERVGPWWGQGCDADGDMLVRFA